MKKRISKNNHKKTSKNTSGSLFSPILAPNLAPGGGVHQVTFSRCFQLWAVLGPKWLPGLPQEPPEPPQASIFTDVWKLRLSVFSDFSTPSMPKSVGRNQKMPAFRFVFQAFLVRGAQAQYRIVTEPCRPPVIQ